MNFLKNILTITFVFLFFGSEAQEKWTLDKCIEYAFDNNISIKQQKLNIQINENIFRQSKLSTLPNLNAGSDYNMNFGRTVDKYTNKFSDSNVKSANFYITSSITLFNGFQTYNNIQKNKYSLLASLQDFEKMKDDISLNIATAFLQILFNKEIVKISENKLELSKAQEKRISILVKAGRLTESDLFDLQAQTANDELQLLNSQSQLKNSVLILKQFLDLQNDTVFEIDIPDIKELKNTDINYTIGEIYELAQTLPQIKSAEYKILASEKDLAKAKGGISPKLSLTMSYSTGFSDARKRYSAGDTVVVPSGYVGGTFQTVYSYSPSFEENIYPFGNQLSDNASMAVGFRLSIPIFNNWQVKTNINNTKISVLNNQFYLQNQKNTLYKDIQKAYFDAQTAALKYKSSNKAVSANEKAFQNTEKRFNLGILNTNDYNISKNKYIQAKSELIKAKYEFLFRKSILDFYAGKKISINN